MTEDWPALLITNEHDLITHTNYWQTRWNQAGKFFLSINAGAFRLLVPNQHLGVLRDMRQARLCVISSGPIRGEALRPMGLEILFDDDTQAPFMLLIEQRCCDRMPPASEHGRRAELTVWAHLVGSRGRLELRRPCVYRVSHSLPDLRPWAEEEA